MEPYRVNRTERVPRLLEGIALVRRLWRDERMTFRSRFNHIENAAAWPKPVQQPPPNSLANAPDPDGPLALMDRVLLRALSTFSIACGSLVNIQPDPRRSRAELEDYVRRYWPKTHTPRSFDRLISGPPEVVAQGILAYWGAGARRSSVRLGTADYDAQLPLLLNEVMPAIRQAVAR